MSQPDSNRPIFTVSQINREVATLLSSGFGRVWVTGEVSNLAVPRSGHWYLTLKDADAALRCAMFRNANRLVGQPPTNGEAVLVRGRLGLYEARGDYQLIIEHMEPAGDGALRLRFEQLKRTLDAEGLFATERKRPIPERPTCIGVVTSATGAALRDIRAVLARRCPLVRVIVYPTAVQGDAAAGQIAAAIGRANAHGLADVLIVARGGGSLEDLWPFNEESVARAVAESALPVISGVGHEVDTTIADLVADVRAPTPSAAAELAVPNLVEALRSLEISAARVRRAMRALLDGRQRHVGQLAHRVSLAHPGRQLEQRAQRLDDLQQRLTRATDRSLAMARQRTEHVSARLTAVHPAKRLAAASDTTGRAERALERAMTRTLALAGSRVAAAARELHAVSPLAVLDRGFAIATTADGAVLRDSSDARGGDRVTVRLARGRVHTVVDGIEPPD